MAVPDPNSAVQSGVSTLITVGMASQAMKMAGNIGTSQRRVVRRRKMSKTHHDPYKNLFR